MQMLKILYRVIFFLVKYETVRGKRKIFWSGFKTVKSNLAKEKYICDITTIATFCLFLTWGGTEFVCCAVANESIVQQMDET
jgi:hypothetical protein